MIQVSKKWKKIWSKFWSEHLQSISEVIILVDALHFSLSVCTISFFGKILEREIFQVKLGTLRMDPILEEIQIGHKTRTTHANNLFEGVNHIVFLRWTDAKRPQPQILCFLWSYGPIPSYFCALLPFTVMFLDHNSWTTYPNLTFLSIFHNV